MDRIFIILKKENGPRASSALALGLNTIIFKHVYWYMQQTQVSVYRTIGPLVSKCSSRAITKYNGVHMWYRKIRIFEPPRRKTNNLPRRKQRRRSASQ